MGKIYAPLGYKMNNNGKDYVDTDNREELLSVVLGLVKWPIDVKQKICQSTSEELVDNLLENGFELEDE